MSNLDKWQKLCRAYNYKNKIRITVTLSIINIEELEQLILLASEIYGCNSIYLQPLLIDENYQELEKYKLEYYDTEKGKRLLEIANKTAEKYGIHLIIQGTIKAS